MTPSLVVSAIKIAVVVHATLKEHLMKKTRQDPERQNADYAHVVGEEYSTEIIGWCYCLRSQRERVRDLESWVDGQTLSEVGTSTIEEEVRQMCRWRNTMRF